MSVINMFVISGNTTSEPTLAYLPDGTPTINFSVAQNTYRKGAGDTYTEYTQFIRVSAISQSAERIARMSIQKGEFVVVEGAIRVKETTGADGKKTSTIFLNANNVDRRKRASQQDSTAQQPVVDEPTEEVTDDAPF